MPTIKEIQTEIDESKKDLMSFMAARNIIRERIKEVSDGPNRILPFLDWSGKDAVLGSLDLVINAVLKTIEELTVEMNTIKKLEQSRVTYEE